MKIWWELVIIIIYYPEGSTKRARKWGNLIGLENMCYKPIMPAKNGSFKCQQKQIKVSTLRQLSLFCLV